MAEKNWGNCKSCRYFSSRDSNPGDEQLARCVEPELRRFELQVSGASGCNHHEARAGVSGAVEEPAPTMH
jgi:hypothetical protein